MENLQKKNFEKGALNLHPLPMLSTCYMLYVIGNKEFKQKKLG